MSEVQKILIDKRLHSQVKAAAALQEQSIKAWVELKLTAALPREPLLPFGGDGDDKETSP